MLVEMKVAALLNKTRHHDPTILPAWKMLRISTIEGAHVLGLGGKIGSLETKKKADIIVLNLLKPHMTPFLAKPVPNIAPNIVYSARGDEVETVIVNGQIIVDNYKVSIMDEQKVIEKAQKAALEIADSAEHDYFKADSELAKAVSKGLL
jgi:5-methylthioadenosine/S-adenosylhomocysteine deaminase